MVVIVAVVNDLVGLKSDGGVMVTVTVAPDENVCGGVVKMVVVTWW